MICPKCNKELYKDNNTYKCINNHSYDIAKSGYVNLLLSKPNAGDNKELVQARIRFLYKDYYLKLALKVKNILKELKIKSALDCGCGVGYYTNIVANEINMIGLDISKDAINYASKKDKKSIYIVGSNKNIPLKANSIDGIITIFAPIFPNEIIRTLKENGYFIFVGAGENHLYELKKVIYDNPYLNPPSDDNISGLVLISKERLTYKIDVENSDIINLISMTPYFYKTSSNDLKKIESICNLEITCDFLISVYKKN